MPHRKRSFLKDHWKDALYVLFGLVLIGGTIKVLIGADVTDTLDLISRTDLSLFAFIVALYLFNSLTKVLRWFAIVKGSGATNIGPTIAPIYLSALAINNLTPGKMGGEPVRAFMLNEHSGTRVSTAIASIAVEKTLDMIAVLAVSLIGAAFLIWTFGPKDLWGLIAGLVCLLVLTVLLTVLIFSRRSGALFVDTLYGIEKRLGGERKRPMASKLLKRAGAFSGRLWGAVGVLKRNKGLSAAMVMLSTAIWLNETLRFFLVAEALPGGERVPFLAALAAVGIGTTLAFFLPSGSGNVAGAGLVVFLLTGDRLFSAAISLAAVALSVWISVPIGVVSLLYLRYRSGKMKGAAEGKGGGR